MLMYTLPLIFLLPSVHGAQQIRVLENIVAQIFWEQSDDGGNEPSDENRTKAHKHIVFVSAHVQKSAAQKYLRDHPSLTPTEAMAIKLYTHPDPRIYSTINKVLGWGKGQTYNDTVRAAVSNFSRILSSALTHAGLTTHHQTPLYRGISGQRPYAGMNEGETIEFTAYMSTSTSRKVTERSVYNSGKSTNLTIHGGVGLKIPGCLGIKSEKEVLIPPNGRYRIEKSEMRGQTHCLTLRFEGTSAGGSSAPMQKPSAPVLKITKRMKALQVSGRRKHSPDTSPSRSASKSPSRSGSSSSSRSDIEGMGYTALKHCARDHDIDLSSAGSNKFRMKQLILNALGL